MTASNYGVLIKKGIEFVNKFFTSHLCRKIVNILVDGFSKPLKRDRLYQVIIHIQRKPFYHIFLISNHKTASPNLIQIPQ